MERTNLHIVETIRDHLDACRRAKDSLTRVITFVRDRPGHDRRYAIDATEIETELGWRARECFETGIEKTIAWYLKNGGWWRPILEHGYGAKRIGIASILAAEKATTS